MTEIQRLEDKIDGLLIAIRKTDNPSTSKIILTMQLESKAYQEKTFMLFENINDTLKGLDKRICSIESWMEARKVEIANEKGEMQGMKKGGSWSWTILATISGSMVVAYYFVVDVYEKIRH